MQILNELINSLIPFLIMVIYKHSHTLIFG